MADLWGLLTFLLLFMVTISWGEVLDAARCKQLGFSPSLVCASCKQLDQFNLGKLTDDCTACCQPDGDDGQSDKQLFPYAELAVCG